MDRQRSQAAGSRVDEPAPDHAPEAPFPRRLYDEQHSFILQAVMDMQKSIGRLEAKVDRLVDDGRSTRDKVDRLQSIAWWIAGVFSVVGFVVAMIPGSYKEALFKRLFG